MKVAIHSYRRKNTDFPDTPRCNLSLKYDQTSNTETPDLAIEITAATTCSERPHLCDSSLMSFLHYSVDFTVAIENQAKLENFTRFWVDNPLADAIKPCKRVYNAVTVRAFLAYSSQSEEASITTYL